VRRVGGREALTVMLRTLVQRGHVLEGRGSDLGDAPPWLLLIEMG